jgi:hypothetical protein
MDGADETRIEVSKTKVTLLMAGAGAFVAGGVWFWLDAADIVASLPAAHPAKSLILVRGVGLASIIFFGLCAVLALRKLFDRKPDLILNSSGVVDNSSYVSAGFIPWGEILGAEVLEIHKQKMLIVRIRDPQKYIERGGWIRQRVDHANYKLCDSPIAIVSNALKIRFPELLSTFQRYHQKYGKAP